MKKLRSLLFHPVPWIRSLITLLYIAAGIITNFYFLQVFCVPVWWAALAVSLYFTTMVVMPLLSKNHLKNVAYFIIGTGIPISFYCLLFLEFHYLFIAYFIAILFFGAGLLGFLPVYLLYQNWRYFNTGTKVQKLLLLTGSATPIIIFGIYYVAFSTTFNELNSILESQKVFSAEEARKLPKSYITKRALGTGFKYHTSLDFIYDGWRPPLHDPFFNVFITLKTGSDYPFNCLSLENRIFYYRFLFPDEPLKISCPCSYSKDGKTYLTNFSRLVSRLSPDCI